MNRKIRNFAKTVMIFSLMLVSLSACANRIKASGTYKTKEVKLADFDGIELSGSPTLIYAQSSGNQFSLKIYGSDNIIDLIECKVVGTTLLVKYKDNTNIEFGKVGCLEVLVSSPTLKNVKLKGSGDILLKNQVRCADLALTLQGSGDLTAEDLICSGNFKAILLGSGDLSIKKCIQAKNADLKLEGSGDLNVSNLVTKGVVAVLKGSGDLNVRSANATGNVSATLQGSGDMDFNGINGGDVKAELQGSGDLKLVGMANRVVLNLVNSGDLDAIGLDAGDVDASVSGSGNISCSVSGMLKAQISGSGEIEYKGNPANIQIIGKRKPHKI